MSTKNLRWTTVLSFQLGLDDWHFFKVMKQCKPSILAYSINTQYTYYNSMLLIFVLIFIMHASKCRSRVLKKRGPNKCSFGCLSNFRIFTVIQILDFHSTNHFCIMCWWNCCAIGHWLVYNWLMCNCN